MCTTPAAAPALVAPAWADTLAEELGVQRLTSFTDALESTPRECLVLVDQSPRGTAVRNRRDAVEQLVARHTRVHVVSYRNDVPHYLRPLPDDEAAAKVDWPGQLSFSGPEITRTELATTLGVPAPPRGDDPAFGDDYLRADAPVTRVRPLAGWKRMYVALDQDRNLAVCGAFARHFGSLSQRWVCSHSPQHARVGTDCYDGFSAYRFREDAVRFRAPDAALAQVEFTGTVIEADSAVTRPGMRAERQRVRSLAFPSVCAHDGCDRTAEVLVGVPVLDDPARPCHTELRQACPDCAQRKGGAPDGRSWTLDELRALVTGQGEDVILNWLGDD